MKLEELNSSVTILEWWAQDVSKSMKKKGTTGAFTQQCKDMGFRKSSYECIKAAIKKADKIMSEKSKDSKEYKDAVLLKKRATLAKTFKGWAKKKKQMKNEK